MATLATITPQTTEALEHRLSVAQVQARRSAIQQLMKSTMKLDVDFGTIPGTPKPTLYKPGAEKICSLFQLAPRVHIQDMGTPDCVHYQVRVELFTIGGIFCGEGVGTASSAETKYQWRRAVCDDEYNATPEDRRRIAYKPGKNNSFYTIAQVRTEPEDVDNTILKMAKKRALIDAVLTVTAASDIFTQDAEDGIPGDDDGNGNPGSGNPQGGQRRPPQAAQGAPAQQRPAQQQRPSAGRGGVPISAAQLSRFHAIANGTGKSNDEVKTYLYERFKLDSSNDLTRDIYDEACGWAGTKGAPAHSLNPDAEQDGDPGPDDDFFQR